MSDGDSTGRDHLRRPLLGGGERLREDVERPGGGRPPHPPYGFEQAQSILKPQVELLAEQVASMPERLRARHVVIEATMLPNYVAGSHFPSDLLAAAELYPIGTRQATAVYKTAKRERENQPTKSLLLAGPPDSVTALAELVSGDISAGRRRLWEQIREFSRIALPDPRTVVRSVPASHGDGELITWEAVLNPIGRTDAQRQRWAVEAFERFVAHVRSLSGEVDREFRRVVGGVTFVPVILPVEEVFRAPEFNLLRAIRPMPQVRPVPVAVTRDIGGAGVPRPPATDARPASSEVVAIFDGGLDPVSPVFRPYVEYHDLTPEPPRPEYLQHGAMVTSAFLYGPVELGTPLPQPPGAVQHYRVFPPPARPTFDDSLYWVLDRLVETLRAPGAPRIVGLSFGPDTVVEEDAEPDRWTSELDALVAELGVTFVLAAGNNGLEDDDLGFNRVMVPADMVNGIGVGACTTRDSGGRLARAPYSAKGWGRPGQRIAPLGVCFGGSDVEPFVAFDHRGRLVETQGTSFAAPFAMRGLCELSASLGEERRDPATLRGFAAHFAARPRGHRPRLRELGFGRLRDSYRDVWECLPNEVSVVYQDHLSRGEPTTMRLPFPDGLDPDAEIALSWTLSYVSSVEPANASEYTQSGFEVVFRPHENLRSVFELESKKQVTVLDVVRDRLLLEEMLKSGEYGFNDVPPADSRWRKLKSESAQRLSGKWETVSHGELRLTGGALFLPRLDLLYLARREGALVADGVEPLRVALVVTIRAPEGVALYDRVQSQFPVLMPIVHHVPIRVSAA